MRVLVISNLFPPDVIGGYELQCAQAVADLRRRGHEVLVLTSVPRRPLVDADGPAMRVLRTPDVYSPERASIRSPFWELESNILNVENVSLLLRTAVQWKPDVCYLWNLVALGGVGLVSALESLELPWVWHLGDSVPSMLCNFNGLLPLLGRIMGRQFSGRFLACSRTVVDTVERLVPIQGRTRVIPNWVAATGSTEERAFFRSGRIRLAYAGRLAEEKGVFLLPELAARLRTSAVDYTLEIMGAGLDEPLTNRIRDLGLEESVRVTGWLDQDEIRSRLLHSDLLLFPTHPAEPFGLVPLEAASVGCVPVIPHVAGISEWLVDGVHCIKAEASVDGLASAVERVASGEIDLEALAGRAKAAVVQDFALETLMTTVEAELVVAASSKDMVAERAPEVYRDALVADAWLRRHVLEMATR